MSPKATTNGTAQDTKNADLKKSTTINTVPTAPAHVQPTAILHRTPWRPHVGVSAQGIYIALEDGRTLLDAVGGAAVTCVGMGNPKVAQAMKDQIDKIPYVYNMQLSNEPAEELAAQLVKNSKGAFELVGYASGGTEAVESVIKLARQYVVEIGQPQRVNFIARKLSYHGNSYATLALAYHPTRRKPFAGVLDDVHFHHVSPAYAVRLKLPGETDEEYVERLRKELEDKFLELGPDTVIGFMAETVVGATTGCVPAPKGYFKAMKSVCDKYGALFMLDEVMCGMGRMGTLHAWESFGDGVAPDIQSVAKGLGGGYGSIGAVLMSKKIADGIRDHSGFWLHGHTYQGHPVACAAALAVQKVIEEENLLANVREQGKYLEKLLNERLAGPNAYSAPYVYNIRGGGLFWGIELDFGNTETASLDFKGKNPAINIQNRALDNGLIIMGFATDLEGKIACHFVLAPAYNVTKEELEKIVDILARSIEEIVREAKAS